MHITTFESQSGRAVDAIAQDESFWRDVAAYYPRSPDPIINLEHGMFGAMATPVQRALDEGTRYVNEHLSPFVRGEFTAKTLDEVRAQLAALINASPDEILLTRSASESMQVLISQYRGLRPGDAVLSSNLDYPAMKNAMHWLQERRGVTAIDMAFELPISGPELLEQYVSVIRNTPNLKLILLTQVCWCNGQILPVQEIVAFARSRGIDVLVDSAHALGQIPFDVQALDVDFVGFNLHKWIGAPLGLGMTYIRKSRLELIEPHFGDHSYPEDDIRTRLYAGMPPIAALLAVPAALAFHEKIGGAKVKAARLQLLRNYWVNRMAHLPGLKFYSPIQPDDATALVAFNVDGLSAKSVQQALLTQFGIFTIDRSIGYADVVRATVALTTTLQELDRLVLALTSLTQAR